VITNGEGVVLKDLKDGYVRGICVACAMWRDRVEAGELTEGENVMCREEITNPSCMQLTDHCSADIMDRSLPRDGSIDSAFADRLRPSVSTLIVKPPDL